MSRWFLSLAIVVLAVMPVAAAEPTPERERDVIYGRKFGTCLTMDVFHPKQKNGAGVIFAVSGGWFSSHEAIGAVALYNGELLKRGYTVFAVVHGSQPKYTVPECVEDMQRSVRFIRHNAKRFGIEPDRIGVTGASAGCHLSLMLATTGKDGDASAKDPVDRESSRVQAAAGFFPPTDFFNYGEPGKDGDQFLRGYGLAMPFDFRDNDQKKGSSPVSPEKRKEILKRISPIYHIDDRTAPCLIVHGDKDTLVPIQQAQTFIDKMKEQKLHAELIVHEGGAHGWAGMDKEVVKIADWFGAHLTKKDK
jgi:acetyl esterase/lipase